MPEVDANDVVDALAGFVLPILRADLVAKANRAGPAAGSVVFHALALMDELGLVEDLVKALKLGLAHIDPSHLAVVAEVAQTQWGVKTIDRPPGE